MNDSTDYFANHARARQFPWTLYHQPIERNLERFLGAVAGEHPSGEVLVVGCGLLHEIDAAPHGLSFHVVDIDPRAVDAVLAQRDPRIVGGTVVAPEAPIDVGHKFAAIYAKSSSVSPWPNWLVRLRRIVPGGRLWLSTPNYGEPWLPAIESTILDLGAAQRVSRRDIHPARSRAARARPAPAIDASTSARRAHAARAAWAQAPR
jgi:hypothetical protein